MPPNLANTVYFQVPRILNCLPSLDVEKDWTFEVAVNAGLTDAQTILPANVDRRADWWAVGDQGQTGSCVGWAAADSVMKWHLVKSGKIGQNDNLSVRFVWMAAKETDEFTTRPSTFVESDGTSLKAALDILRKFGAVKEPVLPFSTGELFQGDSDTFYAIASMLRIANYINLGRDQTTWKKWLANNGPILTRLNVDQTWMQASQTAGKMAQYDPTTASGGHAVAMVGYDSDDNFIIRNSWGVEWGDQGFAYASSNYSSLAFTEAYGIML